ncbi:SRPBCC family protein [Actinospongicola halichondriae]|uniref:SRPBCC family protein n=1 Tax=Actinospongicola halichondriae TaxID=3236844 RepID=UPI003D52E9DF
MHRFEARNISTAEVPAPRSAIWEVLRSPESLAELTPLLDGITVDGDHWCWRLGGFSALGIEVSPSFTECMQFVPEESIDFRHDPPAGSRERAGADGVYTLEALGDARTKLDIDITLHVELPLPRASRRAVERIMSSTMVRTGNVFAERLYERLGVDPAAASQSTVRA